MTQPLRLHYAPDNASLCVRLALEGCGIPYTTTLVDRRNQGHYTSEYRAINPHGLIPALETPQGPMFETAAILLWLSEQPGGADLLPAPDDPDRGAALSWLFWLSNSLHPALRILFYPDQHILAEHADSLRAATQDRITAMLHRLEKQAAQGAWWLSGRRPSALTYYLCPMLRWMALYPQGETDWFDLSHWTTLHHIAKTMDTDPAAQSCAIAEGLGPTPFSNPILPTPPEGHAL